MANNESMEMYLETVYILETEHGHAHSVEIAKKLGVSKPSVTKAMKLLKEKGLIHKESYGSITLTPKGLELSMKVYHRHKMITLYLEHSLGISSHEATTNACKMEHIISSDMVNSIEKYLEKNEIELNL